MDTNIYGSIKEYLVALLPLLSPYSFACVCGSIPIRLVYVRPAAYSASAGARALAWWLTAARLQVARIHECIAATAVQ